MRSFTPLLALAMGGLPLSLSVAFAQTPGAGAPPAASAGAPSEAAPLPAPSSSAPAPPTQAAGPTVVAAPATSRPESTSSSAPSGEGDHAHSRNGFYFGAISGFGSLGAWGDGPNGSASISGLSLSSGIAIGGSPVPGFAIAGMIEGSQTTGNTFNGGPVVTATSMVGNVPTMAMTLKGNARATLGMLGVMVDWFPVASGPWHVGGAVGVGGASLTDDAGKTIGGASVAGSVFGGYQWWLGPSWSLGISAVVMGAPSLKMVDSKGNDTGYGLVPLSAGIQFLLLYY
jgi:hypothetical protein